MSSFKKYNITPKLVDALNSLGYSDSTVIQDLVIPKALKRESLVVQSETGSGKTHAFIIPIIANLDYSLCETQVLILSPTRELAKQTYDFFVAFKKFYSDLTIKLVAGGSEIAKSIDKVKTKPQIVIGTPGRIKDLIKESIINTKYIRTLVLDEADMLMDLGFFNTIDDIMNGFTSEQVLVFSATISKQIKSLLKKYIKASDIISSGESKANQDITHYLIDTKHKDYLQCVKQFIDIIRPYQLIIFANQKDKVNRIYAFLVENKYKVGIIHGDLESRQRRSMMKRIRLGEFQIIVASDIGARGIDIPNITDVLNVDLPSDLSYYFHRAGRTGRMYEKGNCYTFYDNDYTTLPLKLIEQGVHFSYLVFNGDSLSEGKPIIKKVPTRKKKNEELEKEIHIAVANTKTKKVKPGYKRKVKNAVEKVKRHHKRKMIQQNIREQRVERYKEEARNK